MGPDAPIDNHQELVQRLDYEVELAVILSKDAYRVKAQDAADYIFGYTVFNDVSARDIQHRHKQWYRGKSLEGFTAMGPWIVTADEIAFPPHLSIQSRVNGELRQDSNTSLQILTFPYVLEELTAGMQGWQAPSLQPARRQAWAWALTRRSFSSPATRWTATLRASEHFTT